MAILKDLIVNGASHFIGKLTASTAEITDETVTTINGVTVGSSPKFTDTTNLASMTGTLPVANGGTGKTTAKDAANVLINGLDTGSSTPTDNDYYISQYVGGGTTTTTYHRRPVSALWSYILGKINSVLGLTASTYGGSAAKVNNHTVQTDVPANAVFTDTNNAVTQTATSTSSNYEVLFSATADNTTRTEGARKNSNLKFNPSTGNLQATQLNGVTIGSSPKFTDTTYTAASATPLMDGTAAVGTSAKYAREDHRHPSDTSKYTINSYGTGTTDLSVRPLVAYARANRFAFLPADQVIIEKTTDGGTTWTDAGYSDEAKKALFATRGASITIPLLNGEKSTQCGVRVTFSAMKYNVPSGTAETAKYNYWNSTYIKSQERYSNLREMWFWLSANNDTIRVQVYAATGANSTNWSTRFDTNFGLIGWSGSDWIRLNGETFGGGTHQTSNYWNWRIIFWSRIPDGKTDFQSATVQQINGIAGYGDSVWGTPNGLMKEDHLYLWDVNQNATFPAKVTATSFAGALTGNVTGDLSGTATTATNVSGAAGTANATRHVWFSDSAAETKRAYDDDFKYNPSTNVLTVGSISGSAASATKATQDESGNNIKASYASSMSLSGSSLSLNNKNGTALSSVTLPTGLPSVASSDNGKILNVASGAWAKSSFTLDDIFSVVISETEPTSTHVNGWIDPSPSSAAVTVPQINDSETNSVDTYSSSKINSTYLAFGVSQTLTEGQMTQLYANMGFPSNTVGKLGYTVVT